MRRICDRCCRFIQTLDQIYIFIQYPNLALTQIIEKHHTVVTLAGTAFFSPQLGHLKLSIVMTLVCDWVAESLIQIQSLLVFTLEVSLLPT